MITVLALLACKQTPPTETDPVDTGDFATSPCGRASADFGSTVCRHRLPAVTDFEGLAVGGDSAEIVLQTRFFVPAVDTARIPTLFANSQVLPTDPEFLAFGFPDDFGGLDAAAFDALVTGDGRELSTGTLALREDAGTGADILGFTVRESTPLGLADVEAIWRELRDAIDFDVPVFVPEGDQIARVADWVDAPFPIAAPAIPEYEPYHPTFGFGLVRAYTEVELDLATEAAGYGVADLIVVDDAPFSIGRPNAGVVSGRPSPLLAPTNLRAAARGTPACYVRDANAALAAEIGNVVRFECLLDGFTVAPATPAEAQAHRDGLRPAAVALPAPDALDTALVPLVGLPLSTPAERELARSRYGSQAVDLAIAYDQLGIASRLRGFAVPVGWYEDFLDRNTFAADIGNGIELVTFRAARDAWLADPAFASDPVWRAERVSALSTAMEGGTVAPELLAALDVAATDAFGGAGITARFRSSGTADHVLGLAIDGLERATSGCVADDLDADFVGPSACDAGEPDERSAVTAVARAFASAWSVDATEQRLWYRVDPATVAPGVLVVERTASERADIRAFTADPFSGEARVLVHAQAGEGSAVDRDVDVRPEIVRLTVAGGSVTAIERVQGSSESEGADVLSDAQLETLGAQLDALRAAFPYDLPVPGGASVELDTEWKVLEDGRLVLRGVRPFLR